VSTRPLPSPAHDARATVRTHVHPATRPARPPYADIVTDGPTSKQGAVSGNTRNHRSNGRASGAVTNWGRGHTNTLYDQAWAAAGRGHGALKINVRVGAGLHGVDATMHRRGSGRPPARCPRRETVGRQRHRRDGHHPIHRSARPREEHPDGSETWIECCRSNSSYSNMATRPGERSDPGSTSRNRPACSAS
jgi:hypothetical protein